MPRRPNRPLLFCEWAAGATIPSVLGPLPKKKPKQRGLVKVEVTTDDESGEDTLRVTYPRHPGAAGGVSESSTKKVRFEEVPQKSALKKTVVVTTEETPAPAPAATSSESAMEEPSSESTDPPKPAKSKSSKKKKSKKKVVEETSSEDESSAVSSGKETTSASDDDDDSEPHPTCECKDCARARAKAKKGMFSSPKAYLPSTHVGIDDWLGSIADGSPVPAKSKKCKKPKHQAKAKKQSETSEADDESSEAASKSEEEVIIVKKIKHKKKDKSKEQANKKEEPKPDNGSKDDAKDVKSPPPSEKQAEPVVAAAAEKKSKTKSSTRKKEAKTALYPEAFPVPHHRRPNFIEPVRAEVLQTERVVESAEDPPPNAFFDAQHNIVRVYYGPVYGNHYGRTLYPRRDPSNRPLPIGMPHPSQNPYYHGFDAVNGNPPETMPEHLAATQGMSMPPPGPWGTMYPPPNWYPSAYPGGPAQGGQPGQMGVGQAQEQGSNRGAFSTNNMNGGQSTSVNSKDKSGANNVVPASITGLENNPYIPKRTKSQFSNFGSNRSASAASHQGSKANSWRPSRNGNDGAGDSQPAQSNQWDAQPQDNTNNWENEAQDSWGNTQPQDGWNNDTSAQTEAWGTNTGNNDGNTWGEVGSQNNNNNGETNTWDNSNDAQQAETTGDAQGTQDQLGNAPLPSTDNNNVGPPMPGAWQDSGPVPSWGDPTMAADTHGKIDKW